MTEIDDRLVAYLEDAHALEQMSLKMLESASKAADDAHLKQAFRHHLEETAAVARRILAEEHAMAEKIAGMWDHATELALTQAGVK